MSSNISNIESILGLYHPVSLKELDSVKLMNRTDTKYLFNVSQLENILKKALDSYDILEIDGVRSMPYRSIYFDTSEMDLYHRHQNGKLNRYKIREREYVLTHTCFLEVKFKSNKGRTIKERKKIDEMEFQLSEKSKSFIRKNTPIDPEMLQITVINSFNRLMLTDKNRKERITIDFNLNYKKDELTCDLPHIVIVEVKQDGFSNQSAFVKILKSESVRPTGMSKYCIGVLQFNKNLKYNNFKSKLLTINKLKNVSIN